MRRSIFFNLPRFFIGWLRLALAGSNYLRFYPNLLRSAPSSSDSNTSSFSSRFPHIKPKWIILKELEGYNVALKGAADWQKASHRKLILKTEEAMVAQIDDAETRIAAIHKKMILLKHALKEWLD